MRFNITLTRWWTENTNHVVSAWITKLFERRQKIPRERSRLTKLSSTKRGSKGRRIPWSVGYQGETGKGLMKTKAGTKVRRRVYASTSVSTSSPREISDRAGCLFAGSFSDREISPWSWETVKNSSRRLIVVVFFPARRSSFRKR